MQSTRPLSSMRRDFLRMLVAICLEKNLKMSWLTRLKLTVPYQRLWESFHEAQRSTRILRAREESLFFRTAKPADRQTSTTESEIRRQASPSRKNNIIINVSSKVARDYTGQMDTGYNTGIHAPLCAGATSNTVTPVRIQPGRKPGDHTRYRISSEEGSCSSHSITRRWGLCKQCLLGTQEQRKVEADSQFEGLELVHDTRTLQDGWHLLCEGPPEQGGLCAN